MKKTLPLIIIFLLALPPLLRAHTSIEEERTCPLCASKFITVVDMSGSRFDQRLDLKPLGAIVAPWRIPVCTKCRFVIYAEKIPAGELEKCRAIVAHDDYKKHASRQSHYLLGRIYEKLNRRHFETGILFLQASWQDETNRELWREDLSLSIGHMSASLGENPSSGQQWQTAQVLIGELHRLLGSFDDAKRHYDSIRDMKEFRGNLMEEIIAYELHLIAAKDSSHHTMSELRKWSDGKKEKKSGTP